MLQAGHAFSFRFWSCLFCFNLFLVLPGNESSHGAFPKEIYARVAMSLPIPHVKRGLGLTHTWPALLSLSLKAPPVGS